ncbi:MurR/RpiR family transcriptional regulator [Vreelandella sp. EE7]
MAKQSNQTTQDTPDASFLARVKRSLAALHPAEKKLADFILDFPGELASYSATELAGLAQVSNSTVSRFIRRLGYESFEAARRHVREEQQSGSALFLAGRGAAAQDVALETYATLGQDNIKATLGRLHEQEVLAIVKALLKARRIWVSGARASQSLAAYFQWQLYQLKDDVRFVSGMDGSLGEHLSAIGANDVVVLFGMRRRPTQWHALLELCSGTGANILVITDDNMATDPDASWHLKCICQSPGPLDNHASAMALCHLLIDMAFVQAGQAERQRLAESDAYHYQLGELGTKSR